MGTRLKARTYFSCICKVHTMAFALVSWIKENKQSIIPSSWVVQPESLGELPIVGKAYWKKRTNVLEAEILAVAGGLCNLKYRAHTKEYLLIVCEN